MVGLLSTYTLSEIIVFIVTLALALKGVISFYDWAKERFQQFFSKDAKEQQEEQDIATLKNELNQLKDMVNLLVESDKDDIKA
jgi:hypothetical protein